MALCGWPFMCKAVSCSIVGGVLDCKVPDLLKTMENKNT